MNTEEVYEYLLCAICPVALSKPGLGYRNQENRIGARERDRDRVVETPDIGFLFPAFSDRKRICSKNREPLSYERIDSGSFLFLNN